MQISHELMRSRILNGFFLFCLGVFLFGIYQIGRPVVDFYFSLALLWQIGILWFILVVVSIVMMVYWVKNAPLIDDDGTDFPPRAPGKRAKR